MLRVKLNEWNAREQWFMRDGTCVTKKGFVEIDSENEEFEKWHLIVPKMFDIEEIKSVQPVTSTKESQQKTSKKINTTPVKTNEEGLQ